MRCKLCGFLRNRKNQSKCGPHKQVLARRLFMWGMWARMWTRMRRHLYTNPCDDRHHLCRHVTRSVVRLFCVLMVGWQTNFPPLINFALGLACFMTMGWEMSLSAHQKSKKKANDWTSCESLLLLFPRAHGKMNRENELNVFRQNWNFSDWNSRNEHSWVFWQCMWNPCKTCCERRVISAPIWDPQTRIVIW